MTIYRNGLYIFTRDLRLEDNTCLIHALKECQTIVPIFIFNPTQIDDTNKYKSNNCVQFMCECLDELNDSLKSKKSRLFYFYGEPVDVVESILKHHKEIMSVYMTKDYTPFATSRETKLKKMCEKRNVLFTLKEDHVLNPIDEIKNTSGNSYVKFTPYQRAASKIKVKFPEKNNNKNYISSKKKIYGEYKKNIHNFYEENPNIFVHGGRSNAIEILKQISEHDKYNSERDYPAIEGTTHLSAYLKFNVVSIREVYHFFKKKLPRTSKLFTQLYWRDFYMSVMFHNPHVINGNMNKSNIKWDYDANLFKKWKEGKTGFPLVDAGMRQLNEIGWMHNRVRMLVANFLVKIMHIDWQHGEKYFAQKLVDYDPSNNNGGWQWCASTGTDSQPYFRYFNPWSQSKKYDLGTIYIKKWIPELKDIPSKDIHKWDKTHSKYKTNYPKPMYDNISKQIKETLKMYK